MSMMDTFELFTEIDIRQSLKRSSNAFCAADPMTLVRGYLDVLISQITNIVNKFQFQFELFILTFSLMKVNAYRMLKMGMLKTLLI